MPLPPEQAWFAVKRYGYGWGLPKRWQGWVVLLGYFAAFFAGLVWFRDLRGWVFVHVLALTLILVATCWWKGEPPRWRWGDE